MFSSAEHQLIYKVADAPIRRFPYPHPSFTCTGGKPHTFDGFARLTTMPYQPNALCGFLKTADSFRGVERINDERVRRDLTLYDITVTQSPKAPAPAHAPGQAAVKFSF